MVLSVNNPIQHLIIFRIDVHSVFIFMERWAAFKLNIVSIS